MFLYSTPHLYVPLWYPTTNTPNRPPPEAPSRETEHRHFNTDYLHLGASTLRAWQLPQEFILITDNLHAPVEMEDAALRTLTLTVAASSAASARLFAPNPPAFTEATPVAAPCLTALAEVKNTNAEALARFLGERSEPVSAFATSVMTG